MSSHKSTQAHVVKLKLSSADKARFVLSLLPKQAPSEEISQLRLQLEAIAGTETERREPPALDPKYASDILNELMTTLGQGTQSSEVGTVAEPPPETVSEASLRPNTISLFGADCEKEHPVFLANRLRHYTEPELRAALRKLDGALARQVRFILLAPPVAPVKA